MSRRKYLVFILLLLSALHECDGEDTDDGKPDGNQKVHKHYIHQQPFNDDDWVHSLIWNLIGYSTVLVPAFVIFRMAKYSNFNEREGNVCFHLSVTIALGLYCAS